MRLLEALFKPQLPKAFHCKRDKEMRKGNIATQGCNIYVKKFFDNTIKQNRTQN